MADLPQVKQQIIDRVTSYNAAVLATREDVTLSPVGRRRHLEELYNAARDEVDRMRATLDTGTSGDRRALERRLFGLPAGADGMDVISFREAQDRVATVKRAEELGELMESAAGSGDDALLRAGFARAWKESRKALSSDTWSGLVAEYADQYPGVRRDIEELEQLTSSRGATQAFGERIAMAVSRPRELDVAESSLSDQAPLKGGASQLMTRS